MNLWIWGKVEWFRVKIYSIRSLDMGCGERCNCARWERCKLLMSVVATLASSWSRVQCRPSATIQNAHIVEYMNKWESQHLQRMPQWGRNANGLYCRHKCIMYSCIYARLITWCRTPSCMRPYLETTTRSCTSYPHIIGLQLLSSSSCHYYIIMIWC